jgi:UDP:flavonoid glycosyltransferase YjiC (YdhE family)
VVSHGGSGTVLATLAHGVPLLCVPRAADQFVNAFNVARAGAGEVLLGADVTEAAVRVAIEALIGSSAVAAAARSLAAEIAAMPADDDVAVAIEAYAAEAAGP